MSRVSNITLNTLKMINGAKFYLDNNFTMAECASKFDVSKRTFQNYMKKLENIDEELYLKVQEKNLSEGAKKGGRNSKSTTSKKSKSISDEDIVSLAHYMVEHELTYRELEEFSGIPKSTLQDNFTEERLGKYYKKIKSRVEQNKLDTNKGTIK